MISSTEPPQKRAKTGEDLIQVVNNCYNLMFRQTELSEEEKATLASGMEYIRTTLKQASRGYGVLGPNRTTAKITWGKCMGLLLEEGTFCHESIEILMGRLNPGGALF